MSKLRIWLKNYIYTEDPSFSDDFKHLDLIYQSCFYDIFDLKLFKSWWKNIILVFNTVFMIWVTLSCMFSLNLFMDDIERFVSCIFTFMVAAQTVVRMWALLYFKEGFRAIRNKIIYDELEDGMETEVSIYYKRIYRKVYISVVLSYLASTSKILLAPWLSSYEFALPVYYQFIGLNLFSHPQYEINLAFSSYTCFLLTTVIGAFDLMYALITVSLICKLEIVSKYMEKFGDLENCEEQSKLIIKSAQMHDYVLQMIRHCSLYFSLVALVQVLTAIFLICFTTFVLKFNMSSLSVSIAILLQLFIFCILGDFLLSKAKRVNETLYSSNWYKIENIDDRRKLLLLIMNSQKTVGFSAGGFTYLSLPTFLEILKSSAGYIALMNSIESGK